MFELLQAGALDQELALQVLDELLELVTKLFQQEQAAENAGDGRAWKNWVPSNITKGMGWARRWS
eukprot:3157653-Pyramimonas_sp.AAC.1